MQWDSPLVIEAGVFGSVLLVILAVALLVPQLPTIRHLFLGVQVPPLVVGQVRLLASAFGGLGITYLVSKVVTLQGTAWAAVAIPAVGLLQTAWGVLDNALKTTQNEPHPGPIAGGLTTVEAGGIDPPSATP